MDNPDESITCTYCQCPVGEVAYLTPDKSTAGSFACRDCLIERGLFCLQHMSPHNELACGKVGHCRYYCEECAQLIAISLAERQHGLYVLLKRTLETRAWGDVERWLKEFAPVESVQEVLSRSLIRLALARGWA